MGWLFDVCPPEYRAHDVLRRHPVVLARLAAHHVEGAITAARQGLAAVRTELRDVVPPDVVDATVAVYERESARLLATRREVGLVERALRGERFRPRL